MDITGDSSADKQSDDVPSKNSSDNSSIRQLLERLVTGWAAFPPPLTLSPDGDDGFRIDADSLLASLGPSLSPVPATTLTYIILLGEYLAPAVVFVVDDESLPMTGTGVDYDIDLCSVEHRGRLYYVPELHVEVFTDKDTSLECIRFFNHIPRDRALFNLLAFSHELIIAFAFNGKISSSASVALPENNDHHRAMIPRWNNNPCPQDLFNTFCLERLKQKSDGKPLTTKSLDYLMFVGNREFERAARGDIVLSNTVFQLKEWLCDHLG